MLGKRRAGKNLLAEGLAKLWKHGTPTPFEASVENFNEALQRCPLLFADERLPGTGSHGRINAHTTLSEHLRQVVTARSHDLNRKFMAVVTVTGCARVVIAANESLFEFGAMSEEGKAALAERLLHVAATDAPRLYLEELGRDVTASWVTENIIARHVLWLADTREVRLGTRLLVEGNGRELINRSTNSVGTTADVAQWLCGFLAKPSLLSGAARDAIYLAPGELWVSSSALTNARTVWELYVSHLRDIPGATALGKALANLSGGNHAQKTVKGQSSGRSFRSVFHRIDTDALLSWAERIGYGDTVAMLDTLTGRPPEPPKPPAPAPPPPASPRPPEHSPAPMELRAEPPLPPAPSRAEAVEPGNTEHTFSVDCAPEVCPAPEAPAPDAQPKRTRKPRTSKLAPGPKPGVTEYTFSGGPALETSIREYTAPVDSAPEVCPAPAPDAQPKRERKPRTPKAQKEKPVKAPRPKKEKPARPGSLPVAEHPDYRPSAQGEAELREAFERALEHSNPRGYMLAWVAPLATSPGVEYGRRVEAIRYWINSELDTDGALAIYRGDGNASPLPGSGITLP